MSYDNKIYPNRKDWLGKFYKSKRFDKSCRCNGSCGYCRNNRLHYKNKIEQQSLSHLKDYAN